MKVLITGKNSKDLEPTVKQLGFEVVEENPEVIISYGGDGTLLASERQFPGIPKLPTRNDSVSKKCPEHETEILLKKLTQGQLELKEYSKLETKIDLSTSSEQGVKTLFALNDFVIRNKEPMHSIRFTVTSHSHPVPDTGSINNLLIGDGIVISTPFGSSGYFQSITRQTFEGGLGLAFNNTTEKMEPQFFSENDEIIFKLVRGNATLTSDNSPEIYTIPEGSELTFKLSSEKAKIYELDSLRCPNCIVTRG